MRTGEEQATRLFSEPVHHFTICGGVGTFSPYCFHSTLWPWSFQNHFSKVKSYSHFMKFPGSKFLPWNNSHLPCNVQPSIDSWSPLLPGHTERISYLQQHLASFRLSRAQQPSSRCHRSLDGEASIKKGGIQSASLGQKFTLVYYERSAKLSTASHLRQSTRSFNFRDFAPFALLFITLPCKEQRRAGADVP